MFEAFDLLQITAQRSRLKYETCYWKNTAELFIDCIGYLDHCFDRWDNNSANTTTIAKRFDYLNNSVVMTMETFGLNTNFESKIDRAF